MVYLYFFWRGSCVIVMPCAMYTENMFVTHKDGTSSNMLVPDVMLGTI